MLYIQHARILTPEKKIAAATILINGRHIVKIVPEDQRGLPTTAEIVDAAGLVAVPGFIDLQLNGGFGHDFTADPTTIWRVAAQLPQYGVTAFLPTIITAPLETVTQAQAVLMQHQPQPVGAIPLGLHIEGPFLNLAKKGAHNAAYLRLPRMADIESWTLENGVSLVTLAPELPDALGIVKALAERGIVVSAGHSMATLVEAQAGFASGIRYGTHLFNAMPPLHHREPGLVGALLTDKTVKVGLIADGIHVHPTLIGLVWQTVGPQRLTLVTDAMAAMGQPAGRYQLGDFTVTVEGERVQLPDGTLAGSIITADAALRNLIRYTGCSLPEALPTLTSTPADLLGLGQRKGKIAAGYDADLVLLRPDLTVALTIVGGQVVYQAGKEYR